MSLLMFKSVFVVCTLMWATFTFADEECVPSKWGEDDQIGNLNLMSTESVLAAASLIKEGKVYSLGITIDSTTPAFPPRGMNVYVVQPGQQHEGQPYPNMTYNDDIISGWFGIGSQIDGLGHIGDADGVYYNCNKSTDIATMTGLTRLGIETIPPIVARGIVLDMAGHFGVEAMEAGQYFTVEDVQAVEEKQGTPIQEGDVVLFHTGWTDAKLEAEPEVWVAAEPGQSEEVASYLVTKNVVAAGADTWGLDVVPPQHENRPFQGHVILLQENGIFILETMNTGLLVREGVHEFLFILGQAKVRGAVQMYINPVAIR
ncbi:MAG: cyclase family protein [Gammaproteobacteria bacterium]|nr:cyclase family protein [Gammaproteobacteria bacterium]